MPRWRKGVAHSPSRTGGKLRGRGSLARRRQPPSVSYAGSPAAEAWEAQGDSYAAPLAVTRARGRGKT